MGIRSKSAWLAAMLGLAALNAQADEPLKLVTASFMGVDDQLKTAIGHPNEEWRLHGLKSYLSGNHDEAVMRFERAAWYADKFSQHYLSLIYWYGEGVPVDRAQAYIWADLAAERGSVPLLAIREKMWASMTPEEQNKVRSTGHDYYVKYGDETARPRAEMEIRRFARTMTGSRLGYRNQQIDITQGGPIQGTFGNSTAGMMTASANSNGTVEGDEFYAEERTSLNTYWAAQDAELGGRGSVGIGPVAPARRSNQP
ncbi:SEL1-like repeat protein [Lysobacter niastensis]|uniref:SEL1-like repeat protein n=1 Tax=Lysobacter niastensis TaxID=380629 RepID=A0ABS0BAP1_9GAMM|nr:SEL1-like repeat protein [Lysobacter niastensis]MBF6026051.1 SEL1-like repeat protein [Lysobacter niastensis]